jgi:crooked neck
MQWEPNDKAWQSYIKLEERYNELDRASAIYERFIGCKPVPKNWIAWSKFEEDRGQAGVFIESHGGAADRIDKAREVFQTALEFFGDEEEQIEKAQVGPLFCFWTKLTV